MVNSKKMSKSTVAIVLLSLLLVLSLILTATGAWFTDRDSNKDGSADVKFGKVDIALDGTAALTKCTESVLVTDGCSWTMTALSINNNSTVDIYYSYEVKVEVQTKDGTKVDDATVLGYFNISGAKENTVKLLAVGDPVDSLDNISVSFDSKGAMNGNETEYKIAVTVTVSAIQAAHIEGADAAAKLANATAKLADYDSINK